MSKTKKQKNLSNQIIDILYDYQMECVLSTDSSKSGIVLLPTGTGKTFVQAAIIALDIKKGRIYISLYLHCCQRRYIKLFLFFCSKI